MPTIEELLEKLGIGEKTNPEQYRRFLECNQLTGSKDLVTGLQQQAKDLIAELQQMLTMKQQVEQKMLAAAADGSLKLENNNFTYAWNTDYNYLEIKAGDNIKSGVAWHKTRLDSVLTDFTGRADAVHEQVISVLKNQQLKNSYNLLLNETKKSIKPNFEIWHDLTNSHDDRLRALNNIRDVLQTFVIFSAIALLRDGKGDINYKPEYSEVETKMQEMWQSHIQQASRMGTRPNMFWAYPISDFKADDASTWVIERTLPVSDVSSNMRALTDKKLHNHASVMDTVIGLDRFHSFIYEKSFNASRSAGLVGEPADLEAAMERYISRMARDNLITMLRKNPKMSIPESLDIDHLDVMFISPIVPKSEFLGTVFGKIDPRAKKFFGEGNEREMYLNTRQTYAAIKNKTIRFTPEDIAAIKKALAATEHAAHLPAIENKLKTIKINHTNKLLNLPINKIADRSWGFTQVNNETLEQFSQQIQKYIEQLQIDIEKRITSNPSIKSMLSVFKNVIRTNINEILNVTTKPENLENYDLMADGVFKYLSNPATQLSQNDPLFKACAHLRRMLRHFKHLKDVIFLGNGEFAKKHAKDTSLKKYQIYAADNMSAGFHAVLLQKELCGQTRSSCKSGNDRTSMVYNCIVAALATRSGTLSDARISEYIANAFRWSSSAFYVAENVAGCTVSDFQIEKSDILAALPNSECIQEILEQKTSNLVGKLREEIFTGSNHISNCLKNTKNEINLIKELGASALRAGSPLSSRSSRSDEFVDEEDEEEEATEINIAGINLTTKPPIAGEVSLKTAKQLAPGNSISQILEATAVASTPASTRASTALNKTTAKPAAAATSAQQFIQPPQNVLLTSVPAKPKAAARGAIIEGGVQQKIDAFNKLAEQRQKEEEQRKQEEANKGKKPPGSAHS